MLNNFNWTKKHTVIAVTIGVYSVIALLLAIIINNKAISEWVGNTLNVLSPVLIGFAIAYLCNPIMNFFDNKVYKHIHFYKLRRVLSVVCTYLTVILAITIILLIIIPQLTNSINDLINNFESYLNSIIASINKLIYQFDSSTTNEDIKEYINIDSIQKALAEFAGDLRSLVSKIATYITSYGSSIVTSVKNIVLGLFISIYILSSKERLIAQVKKVFAAIFSDKHYNSVREWTVYTHNTFGHYIKAQLLDALLVLIECGIIFSIFGIKYSLLLAFIIGITNIIPVFGPFIGGIPAAFIVLISNPDKLIIFLILLLVIQQIDGNFILPKLVGSTTGMTAFGVICAITIMGGYFGIAGMILGVPLFSVTSEIIKKLVEAKLEKKGMITSLATYYPQNSYMKETVESSSNSENKLLGRIVRWIANKFKNMFIAIKKAFKK